MNTKIKVIDTGSLISNSKEIHSKEWIDAVSQKTKILSTLIESGNIPTVMMDSDMIVIDDFSNDIDLNFDIQFCKRSKPLYRPDGLLVEHIASFVSVNSIRSIAFIKKWIERIEERISLNMFPPHETPAMIETISSNKLLNLGFIDDKIISCENNYIKDITKIIHAKGRNRHDSISIYRFANIKNFPLQKNWYLFNRVECLLFPIVYVIKRIFNFYDFKIYIKSIVQKK
jgi:hypothetical protein